VRRPFTGQVAMLAPLEAVKLSAVTKRYKPLSCRHLRRLISIRAEVPDRRPRASHQPPGRHQRVDHTRKVSALTQGMPGKASATP
jgi:hypothetical protein